MSIPNIERISQHRGEIRPRWSVMIPTFNCAQLLESTLKSVLQQDPGPDLMQIEVVDDCSTKDRPEDVVQDIGRGRVQFYRQSVNLGVTKNFNSCLARSRGELVHLLHGDDMVEPQFYEEVGKTAAKYPKVALIATNSLIMDERGEVQSVRPRVTAWQQPSHNARMLYYENCFRTPAMVVRRSFYERWGGYDESLCHTADWEMWARAIAFGGGIVLEQALARYRVFEGNDTSKLARSAENVRDCLRLGERLAARHPDFDTANFRDLMVQHCQWYMRHFTSLGDLDAANCHRQLHESLLPAVVETVVPADPVIEEVVVAPEPDRTVAAPALESTTYVTRVWKKLCRSVKKRLSA